MQAGVQRPTGITILAVLAIIGGLLGLLGGCASLGVGTLATGTNTSGGGLLLVLGVIALANACLSLAFGIGAWLLKPWAWTLGVASQVISLLLAVWNIIQGGSIASALIGMIIAAIILYYL